MGEITGAHVAARAPGLVLVDAEARTRSLALADPRSDQRRLRRHLDAADALESPAGDARDSDLGVDRRMIASVVQRPPARTIRGSATDPTRTSAHDADYWILPAVRSSTGSGPRRRSALLLSVGMQ